MPPHPQRPTPCANAHLRVPHNPSRPPAPPRFAPASSGRPLARPPLPRSSLSSSLSVLPTLRLPLSSVFLLHHSTVHPSLHQLLPVPGPDPSRAPLWCLGGVRARHRPQTPYLSSVGCGREVHALVR